jgi:hypothetical protein
VALISCPECKSEVSSLAPLCPKCGFPLAVTETNEQRVDEAILNASKATATTESPLPADAESTLEPSDAKGWIGILVCFLAAIIFLVGVGMMNYSDLQSSDSQSLVKPINDAGKYVLGGGVVIFLIGIGIALAGVEESQAGKDRHIICPHCQAQGYVRTRQVQRKKGISGTKATAALLTGGASILATGLSRKETETEGRCGKCGSIWHF